ncbi:hypothetical protein [Rhodococcus sp. JVH1]|uniref:hypothetical protein n=1 Tax=Rhodococcus sp. JVH1 TaxID=745408 RepID=UPI00068771DB
MSMIYSRISDPEIRRQYESALADGHRIAGPAADALLHDALDDDTVDWLKTNFLKITGTLPAATRRGAVRMRPDPDLPEVPHHQRIRATDQGRPRPNKS